MKETGLSMKNMNDNYNDTITQFLLNTMLHHVGMSYIIETDQQFKYYIDKHNPYWITGGPWYNTSICKKLHVTVFENYIRNSRTDRYKLMCYIDAHDKHLPLSVDDGISGGVNALPSNEKTKAIVSLSATIYFIDCWLKCFDQNYL